MFKQVKHYYRIGSHNFLISFTPALFFVLLITILSAIPGDRIDLPPIWNIDKYLHMLVYFVQCASIALGYRFYYGKDLPMNKMISVSLLLSIAMGGLLEIFQEHLFVNRSGDYLDFLANSLGAIAAAFLSYVFLKNPEKQN